MPKKKIEKYSHPAAGWGALKNVVIHLVKSGAPAKGALTLLSQNQPDGFDCPGCAWPDRNHASTFEFCENGVKAVAAEATSKRVGPAFFAENTVKSLMEKTDFDLEDFGRLTHPMVYDEVSDTYREVTWEAAFDLIASHLNALPDPNQAAFYTSGRTGNEAAFLYQLFVREYGTNNFPDCSNMCHEPSGVGLGESVGIGKGTVTLEDFEHADTILIFGQNPATNHPRMLGELRQAAKRGATIVSINPLVERGLEKFADPQSTVEMLTGGSTKISTFFVRPTIGGDLALLKGVIKYILEVDDRVCSYNQPRVIDTEFIHAHTSGFDAFSDDIRAESWDVIIAESGVPQKDIERLAEVYLSGKAVIATWGMGATQHKYAVATIQMIVNLMLLRGNVGRRGAGLCPVRGHSNVQGNRTVGIDEQPKKEFLERIEQVFNIQVPRAYGYDVVGTIEAMLRGDLKVFVGLGGNFASATPDTYRTWEGLRRCDLTVHITTKLNRSHLVHGKQALILPTLGRTEVDVQASGAQGVTVEDSMSVVHISYGMNKPASHHLLSETAIVARMAAATLANSRTPWLWYVEDYARIRDAIEKVLPDFQNYNARVAVPGGFRLPISPSIRKWNTKSARANFSSHGIPRDLPIHRARERFGTRAFNLMTTRSHDQYNTTVYGMNDRYRGVFGHRRVVFINADDIEMLGFQAGEWVDIVGIWDDGISRRANRFLLVEYDIPRGCLASYYPETNPLVPLDSYADKARTPTSKSIPVLLERSLDNG